MSAVVTGYLRFIHRGEDFGDIFCPACKAQIKLELWQEWMRNDYRGEKFVLSQHVMPCCGARHTLHEMAYQRTMGFTRCDIRVFNANIGELSDRHRRRFEEIFGCPVRVIYERY